MNKKFRKLLGLYVLLGIVIIPMYLILQTKISVMNLEYENNKEELAMLELGNSYLKVEINESLTRDKIAKFADDHGLTNDTANIVELEDNNE